MSEPGEQAKPTSGRVKEYLQAMREDVIAAAETKVGRPLSPNEKDAVNELGGMMLESCYRSYTELPDYSAERVTLDLAAFAEQAGRNRTRGQSNSRFERRVK